MSDAATNNPAGSPILTRSDDKPEKSSQEFERFNALARKLVRAPKERKAKS